MQLEDIKKLASLVRLDMTDEEMNEIGISFDSILAYVGQIQEISDLDISPDYHLQNIMREDIVTNTPGNFTEKIVAQMPDSVDGFLKVKQIL